MSQDPKIDLVLAMAEKLIAIFEADIAALEAAAPRQMQSIEPLNQELILAYHREAQKLTRGTLEAAPATQRARLTAVTARFRDTLAHHTRMVVRVKNASEGLIRAVAEEVDKRRNRARPYSAPGKAPYNPKAVRAAGSSSMLYNAVV